MKNEDTQLARKKENLHRYMWWATVPIILLAVSSCATVNHLDRYRFDGATLAADMRIPPEPKLDIYYNVHFKPRDPIGTALSIGSNIAKAAGANEAEEKMRRALKRVDVPVIVLRQTFYQCGAALDTRLVDDKRSADFLLDLDIDRYGLDAKGPGGGVRLKIQLTARLYDNHHDELVWRRKLSRNEEASPEVFGIFGSVGNVISAAALASLSEDELAKGFERVARQSASAMARQLEDDLRSARYHE